MTSPAHIRHDLKNTIAAVSLKIQLANRLVTTYCECDGQTHPIRTLLDGAITDLQTLTSAIDRRLCDEPKEEPAGHVKKVV